MWNPKTSSELSGSVSGRAVGHVTVSLTYGHSTHHLPMMESLDGLSGPGYFRAQGAVGGEGGGDVVGVGAGGAEGVPGVIGGVNLGVSPTFGGLIYVVYRGSSSSSSSTRDPPPPLIKRVLTLPTQDMSHPKSVCVSYPSPV